MKGKATVCMVAFCITTEELQVYVSPTDMCTVQFVINKVSINVLSPAMELNSTEV
jgi:hypothetical protein